MSAWKRQSVPLVFLEIAMNAVMETNGHHPAIKRIRTRVDKWLSACWQPLRENGRIDYRQAERVTIQSATAIRTALQSIWGTEGMKTPSELPSAMLALAEDVRQQLPRKDKDRLKAWTRLVVALYDLCLCADPALEDNEGQERGIEIAWVVWRCAA